MKLQISTALSEPVERFLTWFLQFSTLSLADMCWCETRGKETFHSTDHNVRFVFELLKTHLQLATRTDSEKSLDCILVVTDGFWRAKKKTNALCFRLTAIWDSNQSLIKAKFLDVLGPARSLGHGATVGWTEGAAYVARLLHKCMLHLGITFYGISREAKSACPQLRSALKVAPVPIASTSVLQKFAPEHSCAGCQHIRFSHSATLPWAKASQLPQSTVENWKLVIILRERCEYAEPCSPLVVKHPQICKCCDGGNVGNWCCPFCDPPTFPRDIPCVPFLRA